VIKIAASAAQLAKCILLHAYTRITALPAVREQTKRHIIAYWTSWHNNIFWL